MKTYFTRKKKIGRNDPCPCGSGKKYKKCCLGKRSFGETNQVEPERKTELPLRERNLILLEAIADIFGFKKGVQWEDIKRTISGDKIRNLYTVVSWLWPPDTDVKSILPTPSRELRALYLGDARPEFLAKNVLRFGLYADELLIVDPFHNPWCLARDYNPLEKPDQFRADTLRLILFVALLEPWIRSGLVTLIPDPSDFDYSLRRKTCELARERCKDWEPSPEDIEEFEPTQKADFKRFFLTMPKDHIAQTIKRAVPGVSEKQVEDTLAYVDKIRKEDPLALDQSVEATGGQLQIFRTGANLEMALYIAQLTGAFPYTNIRRRWQEILAIGKELPETAKIWSPLTKAFQDLEFKFLENVDSRFACLMRTDGRLEGFRAFLRKIWITVGGEPDVSKIGSLARDFRDELADEYHKAEAEWAEIDRALLKWAGTTVAGGIITGGLSLEIPALGFTLAAVVELIASRMKRREFRKKVPISVFVDLSGYKKKS